ncbi:MAG: hypothetical protein J1F22_06535 [Lachnospiraceae bacterium]|nr:hypothetical protein [Lachnospiraceae bacterium]
MGAKETLEGLSFESREAYDRAAKETEMIRQIKSKVNVSDAKAALKLYNRAVADKIFDTVIGYEFLGELRKTILDSGIATERSLADIPIKQVQEVQDTIPEPKPGMSKYQRLYEGQRLLNKKLKVIIAALVILLIGFIAINFRFEYSIFTYFTNYKANMEEELIDKYEKWEKELEEREKKLKK